MSIVEISVKSDYLPKWGLYEGVREIIQNALDAGINEIIYDPKTRTLTISDKGEGFAPEAFLIGYTTKSNDNSTIGQFGEGLKFGSLALIRNKYPVKIFSKGNAYIPMIIKSKYFDSNVLAFKVGTDGIMPRGTKVVIGNITPDEWEQLKIKFLILNKSYNPLETILRKSKYRGKIYYRGLFVKEVKHSLWGYNFYDLEINRDRNIIDDISLREAVGKAICLSIEPDIIYSYMSSLHNQDILEPLAIIYFNDILDKDLWKQTWRIVFGDNAVVETDEGLKNEVEYLGYKTVNLPWTCKDVFAKLVGSDADIIAKMKEFKWEDKGPINFNSYPVFAKVYKALGRPGPVHWFTIQYDNPFKTTYAMSKGGKIYLDEKLNCNEINMIESLIHESVHVKYGLDDNTPEFLQIYGEQWKIALKTILKEK